jgi:ABC-type uncharacterized transport system ATPase subunit
VLPCTGVDVAAVEVEVEVEVEEALVFAFVVLVTTNGLDEVLLLVVTLTTVVEGVVVEVAQDPAAAIRLPLTTWMQYVSPVPASVVSTPFLTVAFCASRVCVCISVA